MREAVRDKAVLSKHTDTPPNTGNPGSDRPKDGDRPPTGDDGRDCCEQLLKAIDRQTRLLEKILKEKKG